MEAKKHQLKKISNHHIVCYDVDDTLVFWCERENSLPLLIEPNRVPVWANKAEIERLINLKKIGYVVIVWSRTGATWAERVVRHLGITDYVDLVMEKPLFMVDDQEVETWTTVLKPRTSSCDSIVSSHKEVKK